MKKSLFILTLVCSLFLASCDMSSIWGDNENPEVYIVKNGFTLNDIWALSDGNYETYLGVYLSGVRPDNQKEDIVVNYELDNSIIDSYNSDITQAYAGQVEALPQGCYKVVSDHATIKKGENLGKIYIRFNVEVIRGSGLDPEKYYAIPLRITSTSKYSLSKTEGFTTAMFGVSIKEPRFYFYCNRDGVTLNGCKLVYGSTGNKVKYDIAGYGVPAGNYTVAVKYDPAALVGVYDDGQVLPEDAFKLTSNKVTYQSESHRGEVEIEFFPEKIEFLKTFYLPITISDASKYVPDETYKTLFVKVEVKNEYDKTYSAVMSVHANSTNRTASYSASKNLTSFDAETVELQMCTNGTIAGADATATSSTTYNNKYMRIKVIPTDNKSHYDVEIVLVKDKAKANNSPADLQFIPGTDNYYDWNEEKFVLNYQWKDSKGEFVEVEEIIQAS